MLGFAVIVTGLVVFIAFRANEAVATLRQTRADLQAANAAIDSQERANGGTLKDIAAFTKPPPAATIVEGLKGLVYSCQASASAAECAITNTAAYVGRTCWKGIIRRKNSSASTESLVVCSGEIKPKESRAMSSPFTVHTAHNLCPGEYGGVKWEDCEFEVVDVTDAINKAER